jgi:hypothetical protein
MHSERWLSVLRKILKPVWLILALLFLFEVWAFEQFRTFGIWLATAVPLKRLKAALLTGVGRLPPPVTLLLFTLPIVVIIPFKLAGLWLIGHRHVLLGAGVFLIAKFAGLAVTAFLFDLCHDKLMQMRWFVRFYHLLLRAKLWAHAKVEPFRAAAKAAVAPIRAALWQRIAVIRHNGRGSFERRVAAIRRWARRTERA